jgi:rhodanese-related sulfurtransferase
MANEVTIDELESAIADGKFVVDVREDYEFEAGHVPNAHHIPLSTVPDRTGDLPVGEEIWIICQGGVRSMKAADFLKRARSLKRAPSLKPVLLHEQHL